MFKSVLKEIGVSLLLFIAVVLVLSIIFYDYNPINKIIPNRVAYSTPESIKNEVSEEVTEIEEKSLTYKIDGSDLDEYKKDKSYVAGKINPFLIEENEDNEEENNTTEKEKTNTTTNDKTNTTTNDKTNTTTNDKTNTTTNDKTNTTSKDKTDSTTNNKTNTTTNDKTNTQDKTNEDAGSKNDKTNTSGDKTNTNDESKTNTGSTGSKTNTQQSGLWGNTGKK